MVRASLNRILPALGLALCMSGCGGINGSTGVDHQGDDDGVPSGGVGKIQVSVSTTGGSPGISYTITISNGQKLTVGANGTVTFTTIRTGTHEVQLYPVPAGCTLAGDNPQVVQVDPSASLAVGFSITCESQS